MEVFKKYVFTLIYISILILSCVGCGKIIPKDKFAGIWVSYNAVSQLNGIDKNISTFDYPEEYFDRIGWTVIAIEKNKEINEYTAQFRVYEIPAYNILTPDEYKKSSINDIAYSQFMDGIGKEEGDKLTVNATDYGVYKKNTTSLTFTYNENDDTITVDGGKFKRFDENTFLQFRNEFINKTSEKLLDIIGYENYTDNKILNATVNGIIFNYVDEIKSITTNDANVQHLINLGMSKKNLERNLQKLPQYWTEYQKPEETVTKNGKRKNVENRYYYTINKNDDNPVIAKLQITLHNGKVDGIFFDFGTNDELMAKMMYSTAFKEQATLGGFSITKGKYATSLHWQHAYSEMRISIENEKARKLDSEPPFNEWNDAEDMIYHVEIEKVPRGYYD